MMKPVLTCEIVQDLLPTYLSDLTSPATNTALKEHLDACPRCREMLAGMSCQEEPLQPAPEKKKLNYLKKIRKRTLAVLLCVLGASVLVIGVLLKLYVIGFPVKMEDVEFSHSIVTTSSGTEELRIQMKLKNNQNLIWSGSSVSIVLDDVETSAPDETLSLGNKDGTLIVFDDSSRTVVDSQFKPYWVYTPPFRGSDPATQLSFTLPLPGSGAINTVSFEFFDGSILFENGHLVKNSTAASLEQSQ